MVENMLSSFLRGIGNIRVKFYFLLDHCPTEYQHLIKQTLVGHDFEIIEIEGKGGNLVTFERQIDLLLQQTFLGAIAQFLSLIHYVLELRIPQP
jgi:hypothetical protein